MPGVHSARAALACVIAAVLAAPSALGFNMYLNMNQFSKTVARNDKAWRGVLRRSDGLFGVAAPNPVDPMDRADSLKVVGLFDGKPKVLETTWATWDGTRLPGVDHTNLLDVFRERQGFDASDVYVWDSGGALLTVGQLDRIQGSGFQKVLVNARTWGKRGGRENEAAVKAVIDHPWTKGVVIEGNPETWVKPIKLYNHRMQIADYVVASGKELYLLNPPGNREPANKRGSYVLKVEAMLDSLKANLGMAAFCSDKLTIVPAAYNTDVTLLPFLPVRSRADGAGARGRAATDFAPTFMGAARYMAGRKRDGCPRHTSEAGARPFGSTRRPSRATRRGAA